MASGKGSNPHCLQVHSGDLLKSNEKIRSRDPAYCRNAAVYVTVQRVYYDVIKRNFCLLQCIKMLKFKC